MTRMPRSTPMIRPVTTAESPGWLDMDADGSFGDDGVLALIPGPHLSRERVSGSLSRGGRGGPGGAASKRKKGKRHEGEPTLVFHAAGNLTNAVPANPATFFRA